jgi:hypothetical protein
MARPDHGSHRAQARKSSLKEDKCSNASATSTSRVFESIISTMCCRSSSTASYSRSKEIVEEDDGEVVKSENYYFWDDMRSFFQYSIRPVAFITIQESSSVDGSELTLPHVLVRMAEKHDEQNNADEVPSMIQGDNNSIVLSNSSSLSAKSRFSEVLFPPKPVYPGDTLRSKTNRARSERGCKCRPTKGDSNII